MWIFNIDPLFLTSIFESIREMCFRYSFSCPVLIRLPVSDIKDWVSSPQQTNMIYELKSIFKSDQPQKPNIMFQTKPFSVNNEGRKIWFLNIDPQC